MTIYIRFTRTLCIVLLACGLLWTGCDSALDLDPQQSVDSNNALQTASDVQSALVGAYETMGDYDLYGGQLMMLPDLLGDSEDLFWGGTFEQPRQVWRKEILVGNAFIEDQWADAYQAINEVNTVLSALDVIQDEGTRARIEGEAKFIRGVLHFELVRLFAKTYIDGDPASNPGVPIILEPTVILESGDESIFVERAPVQAVYDQVIQDLTDAVNLLPEANGFFADTYVASAMLSRVYLMQQDFDAAAEAASRVIESDLYGLEPLFQNAFNNGVDVPEYVFAIQMSPQDNDDNSISLFYDAQDADPSGSGRGDIDIEAAHFEIYEEGDDRGEFFYVDGENLVRTGKWSASIDANIPIVRLPEMYLTRAEANFREGTSVGAAPVDDINVLRERAGLDPLDASALSIDFILTERERELSFEGHTLHDLKRTGRSVGEIPFDANNLVYPIPQREIDVNRALVQNPGYGS